ncbi:MAG: TetR family transcriptional regulator [Planctomycetota bacterium]|nr:MAG: TetR family transcriptional regulator [Planctomycetota bacterium]
MARPANPELKPRMLEEARRLLQRDGWAAFSLRKVARQVPCAPTAVYLHFDNKDALVHALIDEGMGRLFERLSTAAASKASSPRVRIERMCRAYMAFGLENREFYEIMFSLPPEQMERYPSEMYKRAVLNLGLFQEALAEAWGCPGSDAKDVRLAATSIWSCLHGALCLMCNQRIDFSLPQDEVIRSSVELALCMVDRRPGAG